MPYPLQLLPALFLSLLFGCSNSPSYDSNSSDTTKDRKNNSADKIKFSNLSELSYTSASNVYRISPHDLLEVKVFQADELSQELRVNPNGYISLPLAGRLKASGLTQEQLQANITSALKKGYLQNPLVTIFIKEYTNQRVTVGGDVKKPGIFPIVGQMTLMQSIAEAGGLDQLAKPTEIIVFRKTKGNDVKAYMLNLEEMRKGNTKDPYLQNEDKVIAQRSGTRKWLADIRANIPFVGVTR